MARAGDDALIDAVRRNCAIADARHAGDLTLCIYLLQMREFFRWEHGVAFDAPLDRAAIGAWIDEREAWWERLAHETPHPLPIGDRLVDPFDVDTLDAALRPRGWTYGAGQLAADRPVFFLAERHAEFRCDGVDVRVAGRELARGLVAPVAALAGADRAPTIVVRRESLARWCWERVETYRLRPRPGSAQHAAMHHYGLLDGDFAAALPGWIDDQAEAAVLHERGELAAGRRLGPGWTEMRLGLNSRRADLQARAVRDLIADLAVTLPALLDAGAIGPMHVWFANFEGLRAVLMPGLPRAYAEWRGGDGGQALRAACARGLAHFEQLADTVMNAHRRSIAEGPAHETAESVLMADSARCPA